MNLSFDTIIAGSGLAGACAAFVLSKRENVLILDAATPGSGASAIAAGLVSPLMARRARAVWKMEEAVEALDDVLREAQCNELFAREGVLKPARSKEQATEFMDAAVRWPKHGEWYAAAEAQSTWPGLRAEHGVLRIISGGTIEMPALCRALVEASVKRGALLKTNCRVTKWRETGERVCVSAGESELTEFKARRLLLALGAGYQKFSELTRLHLHPIKGQWIRLMPQPGIENLPPISSRRYIAAHENDLIVGSTYEHSYDHTRPMVEMGLELRAEAAELVPALADAPIVATGAAIRVTVPEVRLPMVGPITEHNRVWIFTGLGSKGLLMAPLIARQLPDFFTGIREIPKELCVTLKK